MQTCMIKKNMLNTQKFKTRIKPWISIEKVNRIIKFNEKSWLKPYINKNTGLRKKQKMILKNIFLN